MQIKSFFIYQNVQLHLHNITGINSFWIVNLHLESTETKLCCSSRNITAHVQYIIAELWSVMPTHINEVTDTWEKFDDYFWQCDDSVGTLTLTKLQFTHTHTPLGILYQNWDELESSWIQVICLVQWQSSGSLFLSFFPWGVRSKHVDTEVSIMRKLVHHKNILQLLDWNTTEGERHLYRWFFLCMHEWNCPEATVLLYSAPGWKIIDEGRWNLGYPPPSSLYVLNVCRALHSDHGICELRHSEDLPADQQSRAECRPWAAEPPHHRFLPHWSGHAAPALQNGNNITGYYEVL